MHETWRVVLSSLGAALAFAVSTNLKHSSAADLPELPKLRWRTAGRFIAVMVTHPLWIAGIGADVLGLGLQILALHLGALAVVQPLLVAGLIFSLAFRRRRGQRLKPSEIGWATVLTGCLVGFLLLAGTASKGQVVQSADRLPASIASIVGVSVAFSCVIVGRRLRPSAATAALLGIAVGICYAADAALLKAVTDQAVHGVGRAVTHWQLYAVLVVGSLGLFLSQLAYQAGPLTASQPAIAAVDPLLSIAIGVLVYDEHIRRGPWTGTALAALVVLLAVSVLSLGRLEAAAD
jgi:hypothetical protein